MDYSFSLCVLLAVAAISLVPPIRAAAWSYKSIGDGWQADDSMYDEDEEDSTDYRFISYKKNLAYGSQFKDENLVSFVQLAVDETREQLLVGGRDNLYRLHLDNLTKIEQAVWTSSDSIRTLCRNKGQAIDACHNFIRVLIHRADEDRVFVCGTDSFNPQCTWRNVSNLSDVMETKDGRGISPFSPDYNATSLITKSGDLYAATVIDFSARDPAISRLLGPSPFLRTKKGNSKWLNEPNFVSTYEIGNFVYFFFRETAVEYINCGKKIFSRVARVCKTDKGGQFSLSNVWTTFLKARLNCSLPGNFPFYFDELQSTFYPEDEGLVYAVFTTPPNSIAGSAVCVYNLTAFDSVFDGPFKHQESPTSAWISNDNHFSERKCVSEGSSTKRSSAKATDVFMAAKKYQLMDQAVASREMGPLIMRAGERWTHIVVDLVPTKNGLQDVMFLATADGRVRKMLRLRNSNSTCLVEEIKIVSNGHPRPVKSMKISSDKGALYIATEGGILKVPVQRCDRFVTGERCLEAQDPYCGWNTETKSCTPAPDGNPSSGHWEQDFHKCPVLDSPVNGGWSSWSKWSECRQVGLDRMVDQCLCRSRTCTRPAPANNGRKCIGPEMEVSNCTVHGSWTDWSEWSACTQTCGLATKARKRQCGNPPPKFGGRDCQGQDMERHICTDNPECPLVPVDGKWSKWSGWSACTRNCNSGIQRRKRDCNRPTPSRGGQHCVGNNEEWRMCNTLKCPEISKNFPWTEWIRTNETKGGYFEQRFRFTCRANVEKNKDIKTTFAKSQVQFCFASQRGCYRPKELANTITSIDTFTSVDRVLKRYCRRRRRLFKKYCKCRTLGVFLVCQKCTLG